MVGLASVLGRGTLRKGRRAGALSAWTGGNSPLTGETTMTWGALVWRVQNISPHYKNSHSTMAVPRLNPSIIYCPISRYINHWPLDKNGSAECKTKPPKHTAAFPFPPRTNSLAGSFDGSLNGFYFRRVCHMRFVTDGRPRGSGGLDSATIRIGFCGVAAARLKVQEFIGAVKQSGGKNGNHCYATG